MTAEQKKDFRNKFGGLYHQLDMEQWIDNLIDEACKKQRFIAGDMATELQRIATRYNTVVSTEAVKKEFLEVFDKYFPPSPLDEVK